MTKEIKASELSNMQMACSSDKPTRVIMDGDVMQYVGIGWVNEGPATEDDKQKLPIVEDSR